MMKRIIICLCFCAFMITVSAQTELSIAGNSGFPIVYRGHLYIKGSADSAHGNFVFDTGASNLYFDSTFYSGGNFNYSKFFTAKLPGAGTKPQDVIVIGDTVDFRFGENSYRTHLVPVLKLKPILGDFADGILGMEYFNNSVLEIDYENEFMRKLPSLDAVNITDYCKIDLIKEGKRLFIPLEVQINNSLSVSGKFQLDFGSGGEVAFTSPAKNKFKLFDSIDKKTAYFTKYGGVGGESSRYVFRAKSLKIGDFVFNDVTMDFSMDTSGAMASDKHYGLLGNGIYERFHVYIDFQNNAFYLKPNSKYEEPFKFSKLGFSYVDRNQTMDAWIVTGLYRGSNAEKQGLKIDDRIRAVNGIDIHEINFEAQKDFFDELSMVTLTIDRGNISHQIQFKLQIIDSIIDNKP